VEQEDYCDVQRAGRDPGCGGSGPAGGTYVFKLLDSIADRNIVQIFNERGDHVYATILAIPNYPHESYRQDGHDVSGKGGWFAGSHPGVVLPRGQLGQEFVYPKTRAIELAKITNLPVLAMPAELATYIVTPVTSANEAPVVALKEAPVTAVKPTGEEVALAEVVETRLFRQPP